MREKLISAKYRVEMLKEILVDDVRKGVLLREVLPVMTGLPDVVISR